jgi:hypothetical protein
MKVSNDELSNRFMVSLFWWVDVLFAFIHELFSSFSLIASMLILNFPDSSSGVMCAVVTRCCSCCVRFFLMCDNLSLSPGLGCSLSRLLLSI